MEKSFDSLLNNMSFMLLVLFLPTPILTFPAMTWDLKAPFMILDPADIIENALWTCPICKEHITLTGYDKAAKQRQRHLRTVHNSDLSQVGGSHGDRIREGHRNRTTPSLQGQCNQLRAIQRMTTEKHNSDHDVRHANRDGLFPAFLKTWWCSRCLTRGTTRDILGRPCNPEFWTPAKAKWWLGLNPLLKQKISNFSSWPGDGIQRVDTMATNLFNMRKITTSLPWYSKRVEQDKLRQKERRTRWRVENGLDHLAPTSVAW